METFVDSQEVDLIDPFLKLNTRYEEVAICGTLPSDEVLEELIGLSLNNQVAITPWNCVDIVEKSNSLVVFYYPLESEVKNVIEKPGAQKFLQSNTLLIIPKSHDFTDYFEGIKLKIGLNTKIFFLDDSRQLSHILGTGTQKIQIKVRYLVLCKYICNKMIFKLESWSTESSQFSRNHSEH